MIRKQQIQTPEIPEFKVRSMLLFGVLSLLFYTFFFGHRQNELLTSFVFSCLLIPTTLATSYYVNQVLLPKYYVTKRYKRFALNASYALVLSAFFITATYTIAFIIIGDMRLINLTQRSSDIVVVMIVVYITIISNAVVNLMRYSNAVLARNQQLKNKMLESELKHKVQELRHLKNQINPHFLFNALNTLYGFALKESKETPDAIARLSSLLDYALYQSEEELTTLDRELEHIKDYISLEEMRLGDQMSVSIDVDSDIAKTVIPPMLLMPFVENVFKHGYQLNSVLDCQIKVGLTGEQLVFEIDNSKKSEESGQLKEGIGIQNTRKRLDLLYQEFYSLVVEDRGNRFYLKLTLDTDKVSTPLKVTNELY